MKISDITKYTKQVNRIYKESNYEELQTQLQNLQQKTYKSGFWDSQDKQKVVNQISVLQHQVENIDKLMEYKDNLQAFVELSKEQDSDIESQDLNKEVQKNLSALKKVMAEIKLNRYLSGKYDRIGAYLSIHPGQGGTEAMDWAEMLSRMYMRFFERKGWKYKLIEEIRGEEAGIKEVVYEIEAPFAYGFLKNESGTHRLVRLSPFNADNLRQTSFALVEVLPLIDDDVDIEVKDSDLSWQFSRSGGAGGQSVNKVNSAVSLTHVPTGTVVKCREERKQAQNKQKALKILKAKLAVLQEQKIAKEVAKEKGEHQHASWGTQIRNYVLHPYQLVKDTRTNVETSQTDDVLDGDLDQFIEAEIKL